MNKTDEINVAFVVALSEEDFDAYVETLTDDERAYIISKMKEYRVLLASRIDDILKGVK